jgi:diguanylate cyclase (GGDEF)-like protein
MPGDSSVLVMATSRDDRRVLFDALDGVAPGEVLSARDAGHAHALLRHGGTPVLAILDFEHAMDEARVLCTGLGEVPVVGLFGAALDANPHDPRLAECTNIRAWLRIPADAIEARLRIREVLGAAASPVRATTSIADLPSATERREPRLMAVLRSLAEVLQSGRDTASLPRLLERAMDTLRMDLMAVAGCDASGKDFEPLARMDRLSAPGAPDPLAAPFVQRALQGHATVATADSPADAADAAFVDATGCTRYAALPLLDGRRNVLGVLACASRRPDALPPAMLQPLLEILSARFAAVLELRAERERGSSRALLDGLTGLPNRMLLNDRLESILQDARRTGEIFAVLFVDLDRFKGINDSLGHRIGDQVLVAEAQRLRALLRASDTVARYAGDEFIVVLRHVVDRADIARAAGMLLEGMQAPLVLDNGSELQVTASIGISVYPDDAADAEGLIVQADRAMYSAKGQGRNQVQAFGSVPGDGHRQYREMESRLRDAEANGELYVHYQPQVEIASGEIIGVEALLRWRHPVLGVLSPGFFLPLAEETGLIIPLGEWVLRRACADLAQWRRSAGATLRLAVNLSALQWLRPNLVTMIEGACRDAGIEPRLLDLEATESVLAHPPPELATAVAALRRMGCRIVVDDAGAGHLAPDEASDVPIDAVKIDYSFVRNIGSDPDDEAVITSMLDAARRQGRRVIAEGVETERQLGFLRERGCEVAQGYWFHRPLPAEAIANLLAGGPDPQAQPGPPGRVAGSGGRDA